MATKEEEKTDTSADTREDESNTEAEDEGSDEGADDAAEDEGGSDDSSQKKEEEADIDYAKELEEEEKRGTKGKPDPAKAKERFKESEDKRTAQDDEEDKPLTRRDMASIRAEMRQEVLEEQALSVASGLATTDPEAKLIVAKWRNRGFPTDMPLSEQIEEVYAGIHRKKLIGQREEALRALKNKGRVKSDASGTQRDPSAGSEPKLSTGDAAAYKSAGFVWDAQKRLYKKPLKKGRMHLYKDPKTKKQWAAA